MRIYTVWFKHTGIREKCLMKSDGNYVGIQTGQLYKKEDGYNHSKQVTAILTNIDPFIETGDPDDEEDQLKQINIKQNCLGCYVTLEHAHRAGSKHIYRCRELNIYLSDDEVKVLTKEELRQWKIEQVIDFR